MTEIFFGTGRQYCFSIRHRADSPRNANGISSVRARVRSIFDPPTAFWMAGDIIEHQFIAPSSRYRAAEFHYVADNAVIAEFLRPDDLAVAYVEQGIRPWQEWLQFLDGIRFSRKPAADEPRAPHQTGRVNRGRCEASGSLPLDLRIAPDSLAIQLDIGSGQSPSRPTSVHSTCLGADAE